MQSMLFGIDLTVISNFKCKYFEPFVLSFEEQGPQVLVKR